MVRSQESIVGSVPHLEILQAFVDARVFSFNDDEHAGSEADAYGVINTAGVFEQAAVRLRHEHSRKVLGPCGGPVHSGLVRHEAGRVGDGRHLDHGFGSVHEFHQHARAHVSRRRFGFEIFRCRIYIQGIVLSLACADDFVSHRGDEFDEFHARRRLVSSSESVHHAAAFRLRSQIRSDGDVRLYVHHHQVLPALHCGEAQFSADAGNAGGIDDDVDQSALKDMRGIGSDGGQATLYCGVKPVDGIRVERKAVASPRDRDRTVRGFRFDVHDSRDVDAVHHGRPGDYVGAHLTGSDKSDPDRRSVVLSAFQVFR